MSFFSRPVLEDLQFKQLSGTTLTLSGETNFVGILKSKGIEIDGTASTIGDVLTYDGVKIRLSLPSSGSSTGVYTCASPTTVSVGGLLATSPISGCSISKILEMILVPLCNPTLVSPSRTFSITPSTSTYEVGAGVTITGCVIFSRGSVTPPYCCTPGDGSQYRSGLPSKYCYMDFNGAVHCNISSSPNDSYAMPSRTVAYGNNNAYGAVYYCSGSTPVRNSSGGTYTPALPSGLTSGVTSATIFGIYPYYWGRFTCSAPAGVGRPTANCIKSMITGGTGTCCKVVGNSYATICVNFGSASNDYIWFATPVSGGTTKTCWYIDALNSGNIGGAVNPGGNLFPIYDTVTNVKSSQACWSGQTYQIYTSNYQTASSTIMELRNS